MAATRSINFIPVGLGMNCSWVGMVTRLRICRLKNLYTILDRGKILSFRKCPHSGWVVHPALSSWYQGLFYRGVRSPGCKADHLPPSSAEVTNEWSYNDHFIWFHTCSGATLLFHTPESYTYFNVLSVGYMMACNTGNTSVIKIWKI